VVDSPPGAGKSTLVVRAAVTLSDAGERLIVVVQTNEQVDDLVVRLAAERPDLSIGRLAAQDYRPPARIGLPNVTVSASAPDLGQVVLTTAAKLAVSKPDSGWLWVIADEAYQMRSDLLVRIAGGRGAVRRVTRGRRIGTGSRWLAGDGVPGGDRGRAPGPGRGVAAGAG